MHPTNRAGLRILVIALRKKMAQWPAPVTPLEKDLIEIVRALVDAIEKVAT